MPDNPLTTMPAPYRLGIDIGGTKIEIMAIGRGGACLARHRRPTPRSDYAGLVNVIGELVDEADGALGGKGSVGIGMPGSLSLITGLARNANSTWLNSRPLQWDIERRLMRPVRLANDANCFALSEAIDGAGAGSPTVFGVILGTGVGSGIVIEGKVLDGANAIAGEWGHTPLPGLRAEAGPPRPCWCGQEDCIETYLSGPALERDYAARSGDHISATAIGERAAAGEAAAVAVFSLYLDRLARAFGALINLLDPHVIVLGGGVSNIETLYAGVPARWGKWVFSDSIATRLVRNKHGDSSGVRGAAWLWPEPGSG